MVGILLDDFLKHGVGGGLFGDADLYHAFAKVSVDTVKAFNTGGTGGDDVNATVPSWGAFGESTTVFTIVDAAMGTQDGIAFLLGHVEENSEVRKEPETFRG